MKLSAIILSRDGNVDRRILNSVGFADEIIVWDSLRHPFISFANHRNQALKAAEGDWVLFIDDDEYVGSELALEITQTIRDTSNAGFFIPRRDIVFHDLLLHGEVGKTNILRLAKKKSGKFVRPIHEYWQVIGRVGYLKNPLYHLKDDFIYKFIGRMNQYGPVDANALNNEGKPFSYFRLIVYPKAKFLRNYFWFKGFLDGYLGLFQAYLMAIQSLSVRIFQWEQRK